MSVTRSGYSEDCDNVALYRQAVDRALAGKRGQAFLREMLAALDVLPNKRLIAEDIVRADGEICGLGAVALLRGVDTSGIVDPTDREYVGQFFGIAPSMAAEIAYINDECGRQVWSQSGPETPEERFTRVRAWVIENIVEQPCHTAETP